jgi:phosphoenolpyruvate carboxykinase (ATP)
MNDNLSGSDLSCIVQLQEAGFRFSKLHRNLPPPSLIEAAIRRCEGELATTGALSVRTGKFTGRSPDDRYIVDDALTHDSVDWGKINHPLSPEKFDRIFDRMKRSLEGKEVFVFDGYIGAEKESRLSIRTITENAWQNLFAMQIFIRPTLPELLSHNPSFTILSIINFQARPDEDGTKSETFIILNLTKRLVLIGSTSYAGEIKKSMFSVMNYLLPFKSIFPMHCSANIGRDGKTALFFGLSGTGKTTLSADPERRLIGDDEHGWSNNGIFNFEGGCYAKCINLQRSMEPQIWNAIKFGSVMENVILDQNREPDFGDESLTENTRVAYPIEFIPNTVLPSVGNHPDVIIFLAADAFGVLPPIGRLSREQAMYHFMSGYTSKLAGTERGITEPQETFSHCFGAPFMMLKPRVYADMLGKRIDEHESKVYLINTGWVGGPYGVGRRMNLQQTRAMVKAAVNGDLEKVSFTRHEIFNVEIPISCPGVPDHILDPINTWSDKQKYMESAKRLASLFVKNFEKFGSMPLEIINAGPRIQ